MKASMPATRQAASKSSRRSLTRFAEGFTFICNNKRENEETNLETHDIGSNDGITHLSRNTGPNTQTNIGNKIDFCGNG
jgi:hypothetical protein